MMSMIGPPTTVMETGETYLANHVTPAGRVPTQTGKPDKMMGRHFSSQGKSGNFEQTGKLRENHTKYW